MQNALKSEKIFIAFDRYSEKPDTKAKDFRQLIPELLTGINHEDYAKSTSRKLYEWASFIYKNCNKQHNKT